MNLKKKNTCNLFRISPTLRVLQSEDISKINDFRSFEFLCYKLVYAMYHLKIYESIQPK